MKMTDRVSQGREADWLAENIAHIYGLDIIAIVERRTVYGLVGKQNSWIWKPAEIQDDEERLYEISRITNYFGRQGLSWGNPLPSPMGRFIVIPYLGAKPGYLQKWLPGRHIDVTNVLERISAIRAIAKLHVLGASDGLIVNRELNRGRLLQKMRMKQRALLDVWKVARSAAPILTSIESHVWNTITGCISVYESSLLHQGCNLAFCHRDLAPHNLLWREADDGNLPGNEAAISLIDFDHSGFDDPLHDLLQFTSHTLFLADCNPSELNQMVETYVTEAHLKASQVGLVWRMLSWPDILIRNVVEWSRHGYCQDKQIRIIHAVQREEKRMRLLQKAV